MMMLALNVVGRGKHVQTASYILFRCIYNYIYVMIFICVYFVESVKLCVRSHGVQRTFDLVSVERLIPQTFDVTCHLITHEKVGRGTQHASSY